VDSPIDERTERMVVTALVTALMYVARVRPGETLAELERAAAEHFVSDRVLSHSFNELVNMFRVRAPRDLLTFHHSNTQWGASTCPHPLAPRIPHTASTAPDPFEAYVHA
jgi:hypothetical protein